MTRKETPWSFSSCLTYLQGVKFNGLQGSFANIFVEWRPFEHREFFLRVHVRTWSAKTCMVSS